MLLSFDYIALLFREDRHLERCIVLDQFLIEVGKVFLDSGLVWWIEFLSHQLFNVEVTEPRVSEDFFDTVGTETGLSVLVKEFDNQVLSVR